jgi:hypothetical protein
MKNERFDEATRREMLRTGLLIVAFTWVAQAQAQDKITKQVAQYQDQPKDGHMCSICVNYLPPDQCKLVQGPVKPTGWCVAFAPKAG